MNTTRKGFLGVIAGSLAAPILIGGAAPTGRTIHQAELAAIFEDLRNISLRVLEFRRRMLAGAIVEPGRFSAEFEPGGQLRPVDSEKPGWSEIDLYGLYVEDTKITRPRESRVGPAA